MVQSQYSSSSDEDADDIVDDGGKVQVKDGKRGKILASALTTYTDQTGERRQHQPVNKPLDLLSFWNFLGINYTM